MRGSGWLLLLCCILTGWVQAAPVDLQRLARAERLLERAQQQPDAAPARLRDAAALLPAEVSPALRQALNQPTEAHIARARQDLRSLRGLLQVPPAEAPHGARERRALDGVLARREFSVLTKESSHVKPPAWYLKFTASLQRQQQRLGDWIRDTMTRFRHWLDTIFSQWNPQAKRFPGVGDRMRDILFILILVAAALLLGTLVSRLALLRQRRRLAPAIRPDLFGEMQTPSGQAFVPPWEQALREAEALWQRGDSRPAIRLVLRATLILLDHRGVLRYDESRANGEVLREVRRLGRAEVHQRLRRIVQTFDRGWYGFLTVPDDEFTGVLAISRELHALIAEGA